MYGQYEADFLYHHDNKHQVIHYQTLPKTMLSPCTKSNELYGLQVWSETKTTHFSLFGLISKFQKYTLQDAH
jgi:hypothetical protein